MANLSVTRHKQQLSSQPHDQTFTRNHKCTLILTYQILIYLTSNRLTLACIDASGRLALMACQSGSNQADMPFATGRNSELYLAP